MLLSTYRLDEALLSREGFGHLIQHHKQLGTFLARTVDDY